MLVEHVEATRHENEAQRQELSRVSEHMQAIREQMEATRHENEAQRQELSRVSEHMQAIREQMEATRQELNTQRWEHESMMRSQTFLLNQLIAIFASQLRPEDSAVGSVDAPDEAADEPPESITTGTHGAPALEESEASPEHASAGSADSAGSTDGGFVIETPNPHQ